MRTFIKKIKNSILGKLLKIIFKLITWAIELLIIGIAIVIVTQRFTNNEKAFLGFRIFNVATGSMEPEYAVGDILISKEKEPSEIKVGDNIVYLGNKADYNGKIITHNVIEIEKDENGDYLFHTKGRANTVEDPIVHEDQIYGTVVQNNEVLAWLCRILTNRYGLYFFVIIPIILYSFIGFVKVQDEKMKEEKELKRLEKEKRKKKKQEEILEEEDIEEVDEVDEEIEAEESQEEEEVVEKPKKTKKKASKKEEEPEEVTETTKKTRKKKETQQKEVEEAEEVVKKPRTKRKKTEEE